MAFTGFIVTSATGPGALAGEELSKAMTLATGSLGVDYAAFTVARDVVSFKLNSIDFARLAYELGTDQEGLVTKAYLASCEGKTSESCKNALVVMKKAAKTGHMCQNWSGKDSAPNYKDKK